MANRSLALMLPLIAAFPSVAGSTLLLLVAGPILDPDLVQGFQVLSASFSLVVDARIPLAAGSFCSDFMTVECSQL